MQINKDHLIGVTHIVDVYFFLTVLFAGALHYVILVRVRDARTASITLNVQIGAFHIDLARVGTSILIRNVRLYGHDFILGVGAR